MLKIHVDVYERVINYTLALGLTLFLIFNVRQLRMCFRNNSICPDWYYQKDYSHAREGEVSKMIDGKTNMTTICCDFLTGLLLTILACIWKVERRRNLWTAS